MKIWKTAVKPEVSSPSVLSIFLTLALRARTLYDWQFLPLSFLPSFVQCMVDMQAGAARYGSRARRSFAVKNTQKRLPLQPLRPMACFVNALSCLDLFSSAPLAFLRAGQHNGGDMPSKALERQCFSVVATAHPAGKDPSSVRKTRARVEGRVCRPTSKSTERNA